MKKMGILDVTKDLERLFARIDRRASKHGPLSEDEINRIIQESRRERRKQRKSRGDNSNSKT